MLKDNIDLNIWDRWSYETDGKVTNGWVINAYTIPDRDSGYGMGEQMSSTLHLRTIDAERMGLGVNTDEDFWVDAETLLHDITTPRRVRRWLREAIGELNGI